MPISDRCYHVPTSPGQSVCTCLDELMWMRLLCELQARRITQLEQEVQGRKPRVVVIGEEGETSSNELD